MFIQLVYWSHFRNTLILTIEQYILICLFLMATGATLAFFSILHINMFASYGDYYGGSIYYRLELYKQ